MILDKRTYTGPSARDLAAQLPGSHYRPDGQGRYRLRGWCHGRGESRSSSSLVVWDRPDGGLAVHCWAGCERRIVIEALEQSSGLSIWGAWATEGRVAVPSRPTTTSGPKPANPRKTALREISRHLQLWAEAVPVPLERDHPARRWLANRNLYFELPLPRAVRWLPAEGRWPRHEGAGALVSLWARPMLWTAAWPDLPAPAAVELVHVDARGNPAKDRPEAADGLSKRTHGPRGGTVCVLGDPRPGRSHGLVLAEGLADALALAARDVATAVSCGGTSGLVEPDLASWAAAFPSVTVWADVDAAGIKAAREMRIALARLGRELSVKTLPQGLKDPAAAAATSPLTLLDVALVRELTAQLEAADGLPRWEAARIAALTTA